MNPEPSPSLTPQPKIVAAGVAGSLAVLLVFLAGLFGLDMNAEQGAAAAAVIAFLAGYFKSG